MLHPSVKEKQCHKDGLDGGVKNCHLDDDNKEQENNRDRLTDSLGKCIRSPLPKHVIGESVNALHHTFFKVLHLIGGGKIGRASCRERVWIRVVEGEVDKKRITTGSERDGG